MNPILFISAISCFAILASANDDHTTSCVREAQPQPLAQKCMHFGNCCQRICDAKNYGRQMKCSYSHDSGGFNLKKTQCLCIAPVNTQQGGHGATAQQSGVVSVKASFGLQVLTMACTILAAVIFGSASTSFGL